MKTHLIATLSIATLFSVKLHAQFANTPTLNTPDQSTGGKVGIGTGTPATKLDVFGTTTQLRLSYSGTVFSDLQTTSSGYFYLNPTGGRVGIGTNIPAVGLHSNLGQFRVSDQNSTTRFFQVTPNYSGTAGGLDIPAGICVNSGISAAGEGLSFTTSGTGAVGVKLGAYAYNGANWKSMWETQNTTGLGTNPSLLLVKNGGNVGIGTGATAPRAMLDVIGSVRVGTESANYPAIDGNTALTVYQNGTGKKGLKFVTWDNSIKLITVENSNFTTGSPFTVYGDGKTRIGVKQATGNHADALLSVDGKILAKSLYINTSSAVWADYVFEKNYFLRPLSEVEKYYQENKHLPDMKSANEYEKDGVDVIENQALLLRKIEELTIYIVQMEKEIKELKETSRN